MSFVDRTGLKLGSLTVLKYLGKSLWDCVCDCGRPKIAHTDYLKSSKSALVCNYCAKRAAAKKLSIQKAGVKLNSLHRRIDMIGTTYGLLTVVSLNHQDSKTKLWWDCVCICGGTHIAHTALLRSGKTTSCGCLTRAQWTPDDKTSFNTFLRRVAPYKAWRKEVYSRDNYTCQYCSRYGGKMDVHHVVKFQYLLYIFNVFPGDDYSAYEALWDVENGITLCRECHNEVHAKKNEGSIPKILQSHLRKFPNLLPRMVGIIQEKGYRSENTSLFFDLLHCLKSPIEINFLVYYLVQRKKFYPPRGKNGLLVTKEYRDGIMA